MIRPPVSVTIITLNEEKNIPHAIKSVSWAEEVIVVDSGSSDRTVEIAKELGARVIFNPWKGYGQQKNFAQKQASHDWILNIDADEIIPHELALEIQQTLIRVREEDRDTRGFYFPRKTFYLGRWIQHGGWYPNHLVRLSHRQYSSWTEPSVHEELQVTGKVEGLITPLHHFAFSSIQDQILTNLRFSELGSQDLKKTGQQASIGRLIFKPIGKFIETYFIKRGFLDGLPGFIISVNAAHSMFLKYAYLSEADIRNENPNHR
jgi:glycosyltransferase involved in cell wall biosynthesis